MLVSTTFRAPYEIGLVILIASALHSHDVCEKEKQQEKFLAKSKKAIETWGFDNFADFDTREPVTPAQMSRRGGQWLKHFCWDLLTLERTICQASWLMCVLVFLPEDPGCWWCFDSGVNWTQTQLRIKSSKQETSVAWNATWHTSIHHTLHKFAKVKISLQL